MHDFGQMSDFTLFYLPSRTERFKYSRFWFYSYARYFTRTLSKESCFPKFTHKFIENRMLCANNFVHHCMLLFKLRAQSGWCKLHATARQKRINKRRAVTHCFIRALARPSSDSERPSAKRVRAQSATRGLLKEEEQKKKKKRRKEN